MAKQQLLQTIRAGILPGRTITRKYAKLFSVIIFMAMGIYGAIGLYYLPLAGFEGDQTRIGLLPESLFGWTQAQPAIDPALLKQATWQDADVLVIGDSFSVVRIWQTELVRHGLRVRTEHWASIRDICEDFMPWLRERGFKGKQIVLETVERNITKGLSDSVKCKKMDFHPSIMADISVDVPPTVIDRNKADYSGRMSIGLQTRLNMTRYEHLSAQPGFRRWDTGRGSIVARVADGCTLFSHARCADALFLASDNLQDLGTDVIDNMRLLDRRMPGLNTLWVVVPNKTTAYLHPDKRFWDYADSRVHSVNLLKTVRLAIDAKTVDVYPANNQHFSTTTYLSMGRAIYQEIASPKTQRGTLNVNR
jgi:hypothetical protein